MIENIIVSFTSWSKRLHCVPIVVEKMKNQTMKPNKIILNLSKEEFTNMNQDLPDSITNLIDDLFEINWVDKNTKVWKKFLPILEYYKNDVIIPIDDDINYPNNYIEIMYNEYLRWGKQCPIVSYPNLRKNNVYSHSGAFSLIKYDFFGDYLNDIYNNLILKNDSIHWQSDTVYSYAIWLNGKRYKYTKEIDAKYYLESSEENKKNAYSNYGFGFNQLMNKQINLIQEYIKQKYNKTYDDLFKSDIIVNFTTWKKRECFVPKMIDTITKQTLKPTKIVCWLSSEEYQNKIPTVIENLLKEGKINEVNFVEGNTYAHKRWETFKKYNNCYNIMVDDDIYYDKNYIKELYETALKNQGTNIVWTSCVEDFVKNKRIFKSYESKSKRLCSFCGMTCLPPYTFPVESFEYQKLRDEFVKKCDDSWCKAFYLKNDINTISIHDRNKVNWKEIEGTETNGLWAENKKYINGTQQRTINFSNSIIIANAIEEVKNVYPQFDFMSCCDGKLLNFNHKYNYGVTLCVTAYNASLYIKECLDSIKDQTWFKTHDNWECIIGIDNCKSTFEKCKEIMNQYDLNHFKFLLMDSNMGTYVTTNTVMSQSKYSSLIRVDSDDILLPNMVEEIMNNYNNGDIIKFKIQNFGETNEISYGKGVISIKHEIFDMFGGYNNFRCGGDSELLTRLKKFVNIYSIDKVLYNRRIHENSLTQKNGIFYNGRNNKGLYRKKIIDYVNQLNISNKQDAKIKMYTNTYKDLKLLNDNTKIIFSESIIDYDVEKFFIKPNNNNRLTPLNQSQKKKYTHSYTNKGDFYSFTQ